MKVEKIIKLQMVYKYVQKPSYNSTFKFIQTKKIIIQSSY